VASPRPVLMTCATVIRLTWRRRRGPTADDVARLGRDLGPPRRHCEGECLEEN
jgi:hypothetical protein